MHDTGLSLLKQPIQDHLAKLEERLEARLAEVNQRIASGENDHVETIKRGPQVRWALRYPRSSEPVNHPVFDALKQVDIGSVLHFVNQHCHFMDAFDHILGRYTKQEADDRTITACLIAWGTNMGLGRMGNISDIGYQALSAASDNFIRLETLRGANDRLSNAIAALPLFRHYDLGDTLHSSSDGQKFETGISTINARHSPKYFGLKKGVVSYTLVANHVPINADIISAHDHESHYVFDILFNNTTDIQPEVHSTDTHGTNANLLDYRERTGDVQGAALLKQVSPVAWQHLNFYGRCEFRKGPEIIDINEVIEELAQIQVVPELVSTV